jgi:hypothetical protein
MTLTTGETLVTETMTLINQAPCTGYIDGIAMSDIIVLKNLFYLYEFGDIRSQIHSNQNCFGTRSSAGGL